MTVPSVSTSSEASSGARFALAHERLAAADEARSAYLDRVVRAQIAAARPKHTGKRKLTEEEVADVRRMRAQGLTLKKIGAEVGVTYEAIRYLLDGHTYRGSP